MHSVIWELISRTSWHNLLTLFLKFPDFFSYIVCIVITVIIDMCDYPIINKNSHLKNFLKIMERGYEVQSGRPSNYIFSEQALL